MHGMIGFGITSSIILETAHAQPEAAGRCDGSGGETYLVEEGENQGTDIYPSGRREDAFCTGDLSTYYSHGLAVDLPRAGLRFLDTLWV